MDLSDKSADILVTAPDGAVLVDTKLALTEPVLARFFNQCRGSRVVIEAGTHSPWVDRLAKRQGCHSLVFNPHRVRLIAERQGCHSLVFNPHRVRLIAESIGKGDDTDKATLNFLGRVGTGNIPTVIHRGEQAQQDMAILNARSLFVRQRTALMLHARSVAKSAGRRQEGWEWVLVNGRKHHLVPQELAPALEPVLRQAEELKAVIREYDHRIEQVIRERYPEALRLQQIPGVGPVISLSFVLVMHTPERFANGRKVGKYLGLAPKRRQSGPRNPELSITKAGNKEMRRLLVQGAQHIISRRGADSDLRRWALSKTDGGGKGRYRRGVIALARKLAIVMHRLLITGADYERFRKPEEVTTTA
jgi:transposase